MTEISSRVVRFYLSAEGRKALRGVVPVRGSFQAQVVDTVGLGPLVYLPSTRRAVGFEEAVPVILLRWGYIASMTFDYQPEGGTPRVPIGFRSG